MKFKKKLDWTFVDAINDFISGEPVITISDKMYFGEGLHSFSAAEIQVNNAILATIYAEAIRRGFHGALFTTETENGDTNIACALLYIQRQYGQFAPYNCRVGKTGPIVQVCLEEDFAEPRCLPVILHFSKIDNAFLLSVNAAEETVGHKISSNALCFVDGPLLQELSTSVPCDLYDMDRICLTEEFEIYNRLFGDMTIDPLGFIVADSVHLFQPYSSINKRAVIQKVEEYFDTVYKVSVKRWITNKLPENKALNKFLFVGR